MEVLAIQPGTFLLKNNSGRMSAHINYIHSIDLRNFILILGLVLSIVKWGMFALNISNKNSSLSQKMC